MSGRSPHISRYSPDPRLQYPHVAMATPSHLLLFVSQPCRPAVVSLPPPPPPHRRTSPLPLSPTPSPHPGDSLKSGAGDSTILQACSNPPPPLSFFVLWSLSFVLFCGPLSLSLSFSFPSSTLTSWAIVNTTDPRYSLSLARSLARTSILRNHGGSIFISRRPCPPRY